VLCWPFFKNSFVSLGVGYFPKGNGQRKLVASFALAVAEWPSTEGSTGNKRDSNLYFVSMVSSLTD
jgi:hypothetical protein